MSVNPLVVFQLPVRPVCIHLAEAVVLGAALIRDLADRRAAGRVEGGHKLETGGLQQVVTAEILPVDGDAVGLQRAVAVLHHQTSAIEHLGAHLRKASAQDEQPQE